MRLPDKLADLIVHLANGGQVAQSLELARTLLPRLAGQQGAYEMYQFEQVLSTVTPVLARQGGLDGLALLCDALATAIREPSGDDTRPHSDHSAIWRPAIEEHPQNGPTGFRASRQLLVTAVRDAAETLVREHVAELRAVVALLQQHDSVIFQRLVLHLLHLFPSDAPDLVQSYLTDYTYFSQPAFQHEYYLLAKVGFAHIAPAAQEEILRWVEDGPNQKPSAETDGGEDHVAGKDGEAREEELEDTHGVDFSDQEDADDAWRLVILEPFHEGLRADWRARYDALIARLGPPDHPEFAYYLTTGWAGSKSPLSVERLRALTADELRDFFRQWTPSSDFLGPSREGLGRMLGELVEAEPERLTEWVDVLEGAPMEYVSGVLGGLVTTVRGKRAIPWDPTLRLCVRCMEHAMTRHGAGQQGTLEDGGDDGSYRVDGGSGDEDISQERDWVRSQIAHLLAAGLGSEQQTIPYVLRERVWTLLEALAADRNPTPEHEARFGGANMSPWDLSINTVRGEALHAVVYYAWWVHRQLHSHPHEGSGVDTDLDELVEPGFAAMPEAQAVLVRHLDPDHDPSLAVRSVYGQRFPVLAVLDKNWATRHVPEIFPAPLDQRALWDAAWETFVLLCGATTATYLLLHEEYTRAIERIGTHPRERNYPFDPDVQLGVHLLTLYWRGDLPLAEEGNLVTSYFAHAPDTVCLRALNTVGHLLHNAKDNIPPEFIERLQVFWEWWIQSASATGAVTPPSTATASQRPASAAFGWWVGSGKFDAQWAVQQLHVVLRLNRGDVEGYPLVIERLAEIAPSQPLTAIQCLELMLEADVRKVGYSLARDQMTSVFQTVKDSDEPDAKEVATRFINRLAAQGYMDYLDYLPN